MGSGLAPVIPTMEARDMTVLAQLHAALDSVVETEAALRAVADAGYRQPATRRLEELLHESRELLRSLLTRRPELAR
jgi:hypothetical protein